MFSQGTSNSPVTEQPARQTLTTVWRAALAISGVAAMAAGMTDRRNGEAPARRA